MSHDTMPDGSCSCGARRSCLDCNAPLRLLGYDIEERYGFGHVWSTCESEPCNPTPPSTSEEEPPEPSTVDYDHIVEDED